MKIWDANDCQLKSTLDRQLNAVEIVAFAPNSDRIQLGLRNGAVKIWNTVNGKLHDVLKSRPDRVTYNMTFSSNAGKIASLYNDGICQIVNVTTKQIECTLKRSNCAVLGMAFSPKCDKLAMAVYGNNAEIWDIISHPLGPMPGQSGIIGQFSLRFKNTGKRDPNTVDQFDTSFPQHPMKIDKVLFSPKGDKVISGSIDGTLKIWSAINGKEEYTLNNHSLFSPVTFSPRGDRIVLNNLFEGTARLWNLIQGKLEHTFRLPSGLKGVAFSPSGEKVAIMSTLTRVVSTIRVWNTFNGEQESMLEHESDDIMSFVFLPDDIWILTLYRSGRVNL